MLLLLRFCYKEKCPSVRHISHGAFFIRRSWNCLKMTLIDKQVTGNYTKRILLTGGAGFMYVRRMRNFHVHDLHNFSFSQ